MPHPQSLPTRPRRKQRGSSRNGDNTAKKKQKRRSTVKGKGKTREPTPEPFLVWPEYPRGPVTVEQMHEIDLQQKAYIAYHGTSPWSPENLWGPDEDSSVEESDSCEEGGEKADEGKEEDAVDNHCPESLEDVDILRAIEFALNAVRQWRDDQQLPHQPHPNIAQSGSQPSDFANLVVPSTRDNAMHVVPIPVANEDTQGGESAAEYNSRLRPRNKMRKTEKARKLYRM